MRACVLVAVAVILLAPATAGAHIRSGTLSTDFEARVSHFRPTAHGLAARVLDGDQRLELRVAPPRVVIVLGIEGEPFLRFSSTGVEANLASPTAATERVISPGEAVFSRACEMATGESCTRVRMAQPAATGAHRAQWLDPSE